MTQPNELLPCPFNKHAEVSMSWGESKAYGKRYHIECEICSALGPVCETELEAVAAWNTRAAPECSDVLGIDLEAYADALEGRGDLAYVWQDKPHRLVFDLLNYIKSMASNSAPECSDVGLEELKDQIALLLRVMFPDEAWQTYVNAASGVLHTTRAYLTTKQKSE